MARKGRTLELTAIPTPAPEGGDVARNPETGTTIQGETVEEALTTFRVTEYADTTDCFRKRGNSGVGATGLCRGKAARQPFGPAARIYRLCGAKSRRAKDRHLGRSAQAGRYIG